LGGGNHIGSGTVDLINCTIAANTANPSIGYHPGTGQGGGVSNTGGTVHARNTLIGGNTATTALDFSGALASWGHNLIGNSEGGSGFDDTDLLNVNPLLGPPQDNGGPTQTMALLPGSPAIDAGDNTDAPDWDQRGPGYPRIVNGIIDIGAFEYQGDGSGPAPSQVSRASVYPLAVPPSFLPQGMDHSAVLLSALSFTPAPIASEADAGTSGTSEAVGSSVDRTFVSRPENDARRVDTWWDQLEPGDLGPLFLSQPWKGGGQ
jgi:hypothetical protein